MKTVVSTEQYAKVYNTDTNELIVTITEPSRSDELFEPIANKTLYVEFPVFVKADANLEEKYDSGFKRIEIPNTANVQPNNRPKIYTNEVKAYIPLPSVELTKVDSGGSIAIFLPGAEFTLKNITQTTLQDRIFTTDEDGKIKVDQLIPGHIYTLKESKSPEGYVLEAANKWTLTAGTDGSVAISGGPDESIDNGGIIAKNTKPETPSIEKLLKGASQNEFSKPTDDDPYILPNNDEILTYQVKVPIGSVAGYSKLEISDTVDPLLFPVPNTLKIFLEEEPTVEFSYAYEMVGRTMTMSKTGNFEQIANKTIVFEIQAYVNPDIKAVFENKPDGKIPNLASVKLNGGPKVDSNTVVSQVTRGKVSLKKTISDSNGNNPVDLPDGLTAGFDLYRVVGTADPISNPEENDDVLVGDILISGAGAVEVRNLEPGDYYFLETSAPKGYISQDGMIPAGGFKIEATGGDANITGNPIQPYVTDNRLAETPTINKQVKGDNRPEYSSETYPIGIGEVWKYGIDFKIPSSADDIDYTIIDNIPNHFEVQDVKVFLKNSSDTTWPTEEDNIAKNFLSTGGWNNQNQIKFILPSSIVSDYKGTDIRIEVSVKVKPGINLVDTGIVLQDGTIPNTVSLEYGETKIFSTVSVKPTILRDIEFTKLLGTTGLSGALFKLYKYNPDGSVGDPIIEPFTGDPGRAYASTSDYEGIVKYKNVPVGEYWMVETAPSDTVPIHDRIQVIVNGVGAVKFIVFRDENGIDIDSEKVYNNKLLTFNGVKTWIDNENSHGTRPNSIVVKLYRKLGENGQPELIETKDVLYPWTYEFISEDGKPELLKYDPVSKGEYIYYIEEDSIPNYSTVIDGFNITNTLDETNFRIIKRDGDTNEAIVGTTFILEEPNGNIQEVKSADLGLIQFEGVKKGITYKLYEKQDDFSKGYIYNSGVVLVKINEAGVPSFVPDKFNLVDPDENEATDNSGYLFLNYKKPEPEKKIKTATELLDEYSLSSHNEIVTYQIKAPVKGIGDINVLEVTDTVDKSMQIVPGTAKVMVGDTDISEYFDMNTTEVLRKQNFRIDRLSGNMGQIENKDLIFEFQAKIILTPEAFIDIHPDLTVPNKAIININDKPQNTIETNNVNIKTKFTSLKLTKKIANQNGEAESLKAGQSATFVLSKSSDAGYPHRTYTTNADGVIEMQNLDLGKYVLTETKAPEGYLAIEAIEFEIRMEENLAKIYKKDSEGNFSEEITENDLGNVVDPLPELPTINKMANEKDVALETEGGDYKHYNMKTWKETFDFIVDVEIPANVKGYETISFSDTLPVGIDIAAPYTANVKVGAGKGSGFAVEEDQIPYSALQEGTTVSQATSTQQYVVDMETSNKDLISSLAGKTIRFTFSAAINSKFNSISQLILTEGNFVNTANFKVNREISINSSATVKPVEQFGLVLKKIADFKIGDNEVSLTDATFILEQYKKYDSEGNVVETGPELPAGIKVDYTTGADGLITIDKRLENGKYLLFEKYYPNGYVDGGGVFHRINFVSRYDFYIIEIGADIGNNERGIIISGVNKETDAVEELYKKSEFTAEDPGRIVNKQLVIVPITKVWDDEDNKHNIRPEFLTFTLQRAIVNGQPDELDPVTGELKSAEGDEADTLDNGFNELAKTDNRLHAEVRTGLLPIHFENQLLHRYTDDGKLYNYYVLETTPEGYTASYKAVPTDQSFGETATSETVKVTNTLNSSKNFTLLKRDNSDPAVNLEGARFSLSYVNKAGQTVTVTKETDNNGKINLDGILSEKVYTLKEIEAPTGYQVDKTEYTIFVNAEGVPTVYSKYVSEEHADNVVVGEPQFTTTPATDTEPTKYQLIVTDKKLETPTPVKKINGDNSFNLPSLSTQFEYTVEVPVESVEGMTSFVIEDTVNDLLEIVAGSAIVTADGRTVSDANNLVVEGNKITFTMNSGFDKIANRAVKLSFKAKVAAGVTMEQLKTFAETNTSGIPNEAILKINDKPATSNKVYLVPGNPGDAPTIDKKVNGENHYDLKELDEVFNYKVTAVVPENVLGYNTLVIKDTLAKVLEVSGGVKLTVISSDGSTKPLVEGTDYTLISDVDGTTGETVIKASFGDAFDYLTLAGKTIAMEFSAKIKADAVASDLTSYAEGKIPNKVTIKLNDKPESEDKIVTITPPQEPTIDKKVNGEENIELDGTALTETITYTIDATVPHNVAGMNKFQISDQINDVLQVQSASKTVTPLVAGEEDLADLILLSALAPTMENPVTATINGNADIAKFAGKTIRLSITAKIDPGKELSSYLLEGKLSNTAEIKINDQPKVSDNADITPKSGEVKIKKELEGETTAWPAGEKAVFKLEKEVGTTWVKVKDIEITSFDTVIESGLLPGKYKLTETSAPKGYLLADPKNLL
ncbi:MAG: isopeptide-forming domain-containing fimbrial protein [Tissierellia bacterium]|nr:isopeptide-forming domain-containing fimbrial protein [Tissierellia bacterium]